MGERTVGERPSYVLPEPRPVRGCQPVEAFPARQLPHPARGAHREVRAGVLRRDQVGGSPERIDLDHVPSRQRPRRVTHLPVGTSGADRQLRRGVRPGGHRSQPPDHVRDAPGADGSSRWRRSRQDNALAHVTLPSSAVVSVDTPPATGPVDLDGSSRPTAHGWRLVVHAASRGHTRERVGRRAQIAGYGMTPPSTTDPRAQPARTSRSCLLVVSARSRTVGADPVAAAARTPAPSCACRLVDELVVLGRLEQPRRRHTQTAAPGLRHAERTCIVWAARRGRLAAAASPFRRVLGACRWLLAAQVAARQARPVTGTSSTLPGGHRRRLLARLDRERQRVRRRGHRTGGEVGVGAGHVDRPVEVQAHGAVR